MNDLPPQPNSNNLKQAIKEKLSKKTGQPPNIFKISFYLGIIGFLLCFSSYTPFGIFHSCFFCHFVDSLIFGGFLFLVSLWALIIIYMSPVSRRRLRGKNHQNHEWSKSENGSSFARHDWHNDSTNPASPTYDAIQRSHHHDNHY